MTEIQAAIRLSFEDAEKLQEEFGPKYRTDNPTPAEYEPVWCVRCKKFHQPDPLWYNKTIDGLSEQLADEVDQQILEELLEK